MKAKNERKSGTQSLLQIICWEFFLSEEKVKIFWKKFFFESAYCFWPGSLHLLKHTNFYRESFGTKNLEGSVSS